MRVFALRAENIKKLKVVDLKELPDDIVQISGRNGSGKSSLIDSVIWALGGKGEIQAVPVRNGEESAIIKLDLGDLIVTRKFANGGTTLEVTNQQGDIKRSPQAVLDAFLGHLSFDPLAFARMDSRKQYEELKRIAKVEVDLEALDEANKRDFDARTVHNRIVKERTAQAKGLEASFQFEAMESQIDINAIAERLRAASDENSRITKTRTDRDVRSNQIAFMDKEIERKQDEMKDFLQEREEDLQKKIADHKTATAHMRQDRQNSIDAYSEGWTKLKVQADEDNTAIPELADLSGFQQEIRTAQAKNAEFDKRTDCAMLIREASAAEKKSKELTEALEKREHEKSKAIGEAQMPIPGLTLDRGGVYFEGVPFEQASSAQQLRVSLGIAMAANPKLKVIFVKDGSLLDEDSLAMIEEMAEDKEYQVWIEQVDTSGKIGFVMEDGEVKSVQPASVKGRKKAKSDPASQASLGITPDQ